MAPEEAIEDRPHSRSAAFYRPMLPRFPRFGVLPSSGKLLVSTDLHGNGGDFRALLARFEALLVAGENPHWAMLGDFVHAPSEIARRQTPELYDFEDESWEIVDSVCRLKATHRDRIWVVLGNHDYGHVGGDRTAKFYFDEVAHLEDLLNDEQVETMRGLFFSALLVVAGPCGVLLAHGAPGAALQSPSQLDLIVPGHPRDASEADLLREILWSYGQPGPVAEQMLRRMSDATGLPLRVVVHGHDRDEMGWFTEGGNQLQPVLFGALQHEKRYLELDLATHYETVDDIRDGHELRRLHAPLAPCPGGA